MIRKIITIDQDTCNGCGLCAKACHEGAIGMVNGKATLLRDDYCDGLGDCLPVCPVDAIRFVEREAAAYDAEAVARNQAVKRTAEHAEKQAAAPMGGCPGSRAREIRRDAAAPAGGCPGSGMRAIQRESAAFPAARGPVESQLAQWPVQIKLVPVNAPYFDQAHLLIAADCTAFSYGDFHTRFMKNRVTLIGCPKLDEGDYSEKLTEILRRNDIQSVTVVRMEVPCCGGIARAVQEAMAKSGKVIPWHIVTISTGGEILGG